jgi:hypothetical protein
MWSKSVKKTIYTLNVDNYSPEICKRTYPLIRAYAHKIGANFHIISERKFPEFNPVYEKLQIYELGKKHENDWNIYIDSDALVHPDMPDVTVMIPKDTVMHNAFDFAPLRWRYDDYFLRDGRNLGSCNWFAVASNICIDLWRPLDDLTHKEAVANIFPVHDEGMAGITPDHLIDDYTLSRNIARFGLKTASLKTILRSLGDPCDCLWHEYLLSEKEKILNMDKVLKYWWASQKERPLMNMKITENGLDK